MNYFLLIFISHFVQYSAKIKSGKQKRKQKNCFLQNMLIYQQSRKFLLFSDKVKWIMCFTLHLYVFIFNSRPKV